MPGEYSKPKFYQLALAVAAGTQIPAWCKENQVAVRTAYHWYKKEEFKALVREYRRRAVDRAIGMMAKHLAKAVAKIVRLIEEGQNDSIKLSAAKTLIDKLIDVESHSELKTELRKINERLTVQEKRRGNGHRDPAGSRRPA
jgi:uncharacterized membrane-anchored protein